MPVTDVNPSILWACFGVALWLVVDATLTQLSGWPKLARRFRNVAPTTGNWVRGQVYRIGWVPERNITRILVSPAGLCLASMFLFRIRQPTLLIPWPEVVSTGKRTLLGATAYELEIAGATVVIVGPVAFNAMEPFLVKQTAAT